jgi:hypothetical protein
MLDNRVDSTDDQTPLNMGRCGRRWLAGRAIDGPSFAALDDPRSATQSRHKLIEIITLTIAAALSGAAGWVGVETFAKGKEAWLRSFLEQK